MNQRNHEVSLLTTRGGVCLKTLETVIQNNRIRIVKGEWSGDSHHVP